MKKTTKLITLILSAVLLIGCAIGITAFADDTPTVSIAYKNVSYEGAVKVLYAVEAANVPEGAKVQMAFFDTMPASVDETPLYVKDEHSETITIGDVEYKTFFSEGIAPKNMRKNIYAVPVITSGETVLAYGEPAAYSIYTYAINMMAKTPTEEQKDLYTALLDYGASVQELLLGTADYTADDLAAAGGYADQYCGVKFNTLVNDTTLTVGEEVTYYRPGEAVDYTADLYKDGASFTGYTDENLKLVGIYGTKLDLKASEPGISTITANYLTLEKDTMDKSGNYGAHNFVVGNTTYNYVTDEAEDNTNKVLRVDHPAKVANGSVTYAYYTSGAAYIFETDVKWLGSTVDCSSDNWIMRWGFVSTGTTNLSNASKYLYCNYASAKLDSPLYINGNAGYTGTEPSTSYATFPIGEWHRIRIEYVPLGNANGTYTGIQRVYFDGALSYEAPVTASGDNSDCLTFLMAMRATYDTMDWSIMFDNTSFYTVKEDYYGKGLYANDADVNKYDGENANHTNGTIVEEPDGNKVLSLSKNNGSGYSVSFKADGIEYGNTYVFDTDIKWVSMDYSGYERNWFGRTGFVSEDTNGASEDAAFINRSYFGGTPSNGMYLSDSADATYGAAVLKKPLFTLGVWYNLRIEITLTGNDANGKYTGVEKTYVNNVLVDTENFATAKDPRGLVGYHFAFLGKNSMAFKLDNTFIGAVGEETNYNCATFEDLLTTSGHFTVSSTNGDAISEYTVVDNPKGDGKVLKGILNPDDPATEKIDQEVNTINIMNSTDAKANGVYELSLDMLYDSTTLPSNNTVFQQFVVETNGKGYAALFSLKHTTNGDVYVTSDIQGGGGGKGGALGTVKLLDGEWHNIRFVMYKNGASSVYALYVDGVFSGAGNYYHNKAACVDNSVTIKDVLHRIKTFAPIDTTVTTANLYLDNVGLRYVGEIPEDIPDYDAD